MGHLERDKLLIRPTAMARPVPASNGHIPAKGTANGPHLSRVTSLTATTLTDPPGRPGDTHSTCLVSYFGLAGKGCMTVSSRALGWSG